MNYPRYTSPIPADPRPRGNYPSLPFERLASHLGKIIDRATTEEKIELQYLVCDTFAIDPNERLDLIFERIATSHGREVTAIIESIWNATE